MMTPTNMIFVAPTNMSCDALYRPCLNRFVLCRHQHLTQTLANLRQHLQELDRAKGQKLALFGNNHAQLRHLVDNNR